MELYERVSGAVYMQIIYGLVGCLWIYL